MVHIKKNLKKKNKIVKIVGDEIWLNTWLLSLPAPDPHVSLCLPKERALLLIWYKQPHKLWFWLSGCDFVPSVISPLCCEVRFWDSTKSLPHCHQHTSTTKLWVFVAFCHVPSHIGLRAQMHMGTHMHTHSHWLKERGTYFSGKKRNWLLASLIPRNVKLRTGKVQQAKLISITKSKENCQGQNSKLRKTVSLKSEGEEKKFSQMRHQESLSSRDSHEEVGCQK